VNTIARAIITDGQGNFHLDEVKIGAPETREVLVELRASGVCHTDFDHMSWGRRQVMGHEGAGVVLACGEEVTHVGPGDHVLLNWAIPCGHCFQCLRGAENICESKPLVPSERFQFNNQPLGTSFGLGTMSTHTVVPREAVVRMRKDIPFTSASILGCGVMTGFGSVVNAAMVAPGSSVVVLGTGGVGLSVIQGAVYAGASRIIGVDVQELRLDPARRFGATDTLLASRDDKGLLQAAREVKELTTRGADYAFECTEIPSLAAAPLAMARDGGTAVGVSGIEEFVPVDMQLFEWDKLYINPLYGQCRPQKDFPLLLSLYAEGRLLLDEMVTRTYPLDRLGDAFEDMKAGRNAKGVLLPHETA
jgi:S-(hydroxymethyl)glutathione dehydrogenase/alcohol dehydrogenase